VPSGVAVTIGPIPRRRYGMETESAVLAVVRSAIDAASGPIDVGVSDHGSFVELTIGGMSAPAVRAVASDRVAAIDGRVGAEANTITAAIPCGL